MAHITINTVLQAEIYNHLLIDYAATKQAARLQLKLFYVPALARILAIYGFSDYLELYLLHRHFILQKGEAIVHRNLVIPGPDKNTSITVDVAKVIPCLNVDKRSLFPLMWMTSSTGGLVLYEYGALADGSSPHSKVKDIPQEKWEAFAQDFSVHVEALGLAGADGVMAMLEVEAEGDVGNVLEEDIADGAVDDIVDGRLLTFVA